MGKSQMQLSRSRADLVREHLGLRDYIFGNVLGDGAKLAIRDLLCSRLHRLCDCLQHHIHSRRLQSE